MPKFNNGEELNYLEKDDIILSGDPDNFSKVKTQNLYKRTLTRSQLQALISANALNVGQQYIISNSVSNTMPLKVIAVATNVLDQKAVRVSNGENYTYDIVTDTITTSDFISGEGTADFMPKFTSSGEIGDSLLCSLVEELKTVYQDNAIGLSFTFDNNRFKIGDFDIINNGIVLQIDDNFKSILTSKEGEINGLILDLENYEYEDTVIVDSIKGYFQIPNANGLVLTPSNEEVRNHNFYSFDKNSFIKFGQLMQEESDGGGIFHLKLNAGGFAEGEILFTSEEGFNLNTGNTVINSDVVTINSSNYITLGGSVGVTKTLNLASYTTTQINALTPVVGMMVFNTTNNHFCGYHNGGWVKFNHSNM
jgi:hypothetical protein